MSLGLATDNAYTVQQLTTASSILGLECKIGVLLLAMRWQSSDLPCSSSNKAPFLSAGYAVTVLTAPLPGTWAKAFLFVLAGSWLRKLWSNFRAAHLLDALYVLAIGLNIGRTAGFSASFLSNLPSVQLEHNSFRGLLKVPAEVVSGAHAQAWYRMFSLVVCSRLPLKFEEDSIPGLILYSISAHQAYDYSIS